MDRNDKTIDRAAVQVPKSEMMLSSFFDRPLSHRLTSGRRNRDRTCDIHRVKVALYQLSYPPVFLSNVGGCYQVHPALSTDSRTLLAVFLTPCQHLIRHDSKAEKSLFLKAARLPGEKLTMHLFQPAPFNMGVDLRRGNIRMAQHCLHRAQIGAAFK